MPKANLSKFEDAKEYPPLPTGEYKCNVDNIKEEKSSNGNDMWKLQLRVLDGEHANQCIFDYLVWTDKAMGRIRKFLKACKIDVDRDEDMMFSPNECLGCWVQVAGTLAADSYTDKKSGEVVNTKKFKVDFGGYGNPDDGRINEGENATDTTPPDGEDDVPF